MRSDQVGNARRGNDRDLHVTAFGILHGIGIPHWRKKGRNDTSGKED
jgi:hypothetical protein